MEESPEAGDHEQEDQQRDDQDTEDLLAVGAHHNIVPSCQFSVLSYQI